MGGLLYKDFVSVGGKKLLAILPALTVVFMMFRVMFPGTVDNPAYMVEYEQGQMVNLLDIFFVTFFGIFLIAMGSLLNNWVAGIVQDDDKNKIRAYIRTFPLDKNAYVASKYIFLGVAAYILMSLAYIWYITANAFCGEGLFEDLLNQIGILIPSFTGIVLLSAAIELPMFLTLGKEKAMLIKVTIIMLLAFLVIGFLLFGDIVWFTENFNILIFLEWCQRNTVVVMLISIMTPVITLLLYYLSYRIACYFVCKKEVA